VIYHQSQEKKQKMCIVSPIWLRLEEIRKAVGLSQAKFAKSLGLSLRFYQNMRGENQKFSYTILRDLLHLSDDFQIDYNWLFTGEGGMLESEAISANVVRESAESAGEEPAYMRELREKLEAVPADRRESVIKVIMGILELEAKK
jgi:transcriptional regulator with XRE-family HTH domain